MKIFATGDTHGNFERFRPEYFPEGLELTKEDVVLQLGDFPAYHLSLITKKLSYEKNDLGQDFEGNHRGGFGYNRRF